MELSHLQGAVRIPEVAGILFVLTTTNKDAAKEFTGSGVLEMLFKPYDIGRFLQAVQEAVDCSSQRRAPLEPCPA